MGLRNAQLCYTKFPVYPEEETREKDVHVRSQLEVQNEKINDAKRASVHEKIFNLHLEYLHMYTYLVYSKRIS